MMSSFAKQTFDRLQDLYNGMEDFGPAPLFIAIAELTRQGQDGLVFGLAVEASNIHGVETFIVEGETTNNQVFLECFRRVVFDTEMGLENTAIASVATYLTDFARRYVDGTMAEQFIPEAANDGYPDAE